MKVLRQVAVVDSAGVVALAVGGAATGPAAATSTGGGHSYGTFSYSKLPTSMYGVSSDKPLPTTITKTQAKTGVVGSDLSVQPADVAGGYRRHGKKVNDRYYRSDNGYFGDYHCAGGSCRLSSEVAVVFHQYVYGTTSKRWSLWMTERVIVKSSLRRSYTYLYRCAVNVKGHPDHYCGHHASGESSGGVRPNTAKKNAQRKGLIKAFENHSGAKNYPMYGLTIHWSDGVSHTAKFRGYDTCVKARSTKLCSSSGDGS